jgi:oligosaccharide repeat unit polymerase
MVDALGIITVLWMTRWVAGVVRQMIRGDRSSILVISMLFYAMFVIPLGCDIIFGRPDYRFSGFDVATDDQLARAVYCLFLFVTSTIWANWGSVKRQGSGLIVGDLGRVPKMLLFGFITSPILILSLAPNPSLYLHYGFVVNENLSLTDTAFQRFMGACTQISVVSNAIFVSSSKNVYSTLKATLPFLLISIFLNGKRAIVAMAILCILFGLYLRRELRGRKLLVALCTAGLLLAAFSYFYQGFVRDRDAKTHNMKEVYDDVRVDYGRESRVEMALYAELHPERMKILEFRGQTALGIMTIWVPRILWPDKPYPYAVYFTSAMLDVPENGWLGWGMTTTIFDEMISNFGLVGLAIGPALIAWICKRGDSRGGINMRLSTILLASLMISVQVAAFWILLYGWLAFAFLIIPATKGNRDPRLHARKILTEA